MAKAMLVLAFLSALLFSGCAADFEVIERIGGDVTGFSLPEYSARFYSSNADETVLQTKNDTLIDNQFFKEVYFDFTLRRFLYTEQYVYERIDYDKTIVVIPFLSQILIEGMKEHKDYEGNLYSYSFVCIVDSLADLKYKERIFENAYFITTSINLSTFEGDTSFSNKFIATHEEGIVGIMKDSVFLLLDSIVVY